MITLLHTMIFQLHVYHIDIDAIKSRTIQNLFGFNLRLLLFAEFFLPLSNWKSKQSLAEICKKLVIKAATNHFNYF